MSKPDTRPANPFFSSGPTSKRPGWSVSGLPTTSLGRSHRAKGPKARLQLLIEKSKQILGIPDDYRVAIVPASDTGAFEMAMWSLLGARAIDILSWESFGEGWVSDITKQLKLKDVRVLDAPYGSIPDLNEVDFSHDVVFTWNGTTSGVRVPNGDWIAGDRQGLTLCDATSALYAMDVDWRKLDVVTWSWQKALGGEAAHGMIALSPRAVERLQTYSPPWPMPKIFRMTKGKEMMEDLFEGSTINTPSLLATEDHLDALEWAESIGGLPELIGRSKRNLAAIERWVTDGACFEFLASGDATRSSTSICLSVSDPWFSTQSVDQQSALLKKLVSMLEAEGVAFDIGGYRDAPPGLRIWGGGTVETSDIEALLPWITWGYQQVKAG